MNTSEADEVFQKALEFYTMGELSACCDLLIIAQNAGHSQARQLLAKLADSPDMDTSNLVKLALLRAKSSDPAIIMKHLFEQQAPADTREMSTPKHGKVPPREMADTREVPSGSGQDTIEQEKNETLCMPSCLAILISFLLLIVPAFYFGSYQGAGLSVALLILFTYLCSKDAALFALLFLCISYLALLFYYGGRKGALWSIAILVVFFLSICCLPESKSPESADGEK